MLHHSQIILESTQKSKAIHKEVLPRCQNTIYKYHCQCHNNVGLFNNQSLFVVNILKLTNIRNLTNIVKRQHLIWLSTFSIPTVDVLF